MVRLATAIMAVPWHVSPNAKGAECEERKEERTPLLRVRSSAFVCALNRETSYLSAPNEG